MTYAASCYSADTYNSLTGIGEADRSLDEKGRISVICPLLIIIKRYNLESHVNVRLLHRHNRVDGNEMMIEDAARINGIMSFVTAAREQKRVLENCHPNTWRHLNGRFVPVEFSYARMLSRHDINPESYREFFSEFADALVSLGLTDILGPHLTESEYVRSFRLNTSDVLMEISDPHERANITQYVSQNEVAISDPFETAWSIFGTTSNSDGEEITVSAACTCYCSRLPDGRHQGTHFHPDPQA